MPIIPLLKQKILNLKLLTLKKNLFIFGCAGSSMLHRLFSGGSGQGQLSSCAVQASVDVAQQLWFLGSRAQAA